MERSVRRLAILLIVCFIATAVALTYWQVVRSNDLVYGPYNPRLAEEESQVVRGSIVDRNGRVLAQSQRTPAGVIRRYTDPPASPITGYYSGRYGSAGLEASFARYLRGDVQNNPLDTIANDLLHRQRTGADLKLTLDSRIQAVAAQVMGSDRGAVVALDPKTGAILAMVSTPFYDANTVEQQWDQISANPGKPLLNRATQGLYTPGSVYKIITASAVVDLGLIDVEKPYSCRQELVVDGFHISSHNHDAPRIDFEQGFAFSCNVTFARAGLGLGTNPLPEGDDIPTPTPWDTSIEESRKRFVDYSRRFGMDGAIPFDLPTSTNRVSDGELSKIELANSAFGQGEMLVSPLLVALSAATVANGGTTMEPYLVEEIRDADGGLISRRDPKTLRRVISEDAARTMNRLMVTSVREGYAQPARITGVTVAGKTGSAEVGPGQKTHSWFAGFAPAENPSIAVAVIMENKGSGTEFATPAGRRVMEAALGR